MLRMGGQAQTRRPASGFKMRSKRDHLLVEDAADSNAVGLDSIENDVLAMLVAMKAWTHLIASPSHLRILIEHVEAGLELGDVPSRLQFPANPIEPFSRLHI
jgi:hypothetical protein